MERLGTWAINALAIAMTLYGASFAPPFAGWVGHDEHILATAILLTAAALLIGPPYVAETRRRHRERERAEKNR